ncbi:MAG: hypothetical protein HQL50_04930 [Magnetococcales bacterium]|nr:hypothetical protein [Magnetococcales bacterium]
MIALKGQPGWGTTLRSAFALGILLLAGGATAHAAEIRGNVDLSTVPDRDGVELTIYNSEDITLVREKRTVSFGKGVNPLQFSWANTRIDPTSVALRFLESGRDLALEETVYPHDKPQKLYWKVRSRRDVTAQVEISYFTSGIRWKADYVVISDPDERVMRLENYVRIDNHSGETYEHARTRLVVGTINLVQKIAELANISRDRVDHLPQKRKEEYRQRAIRKAMAPPEMMAMAEGMMTGASMDDALERPKEISKEGLSEYFIYTIEGTETIPDGWSKRLLSFRADAVPMQVRYRYWPGEYGNRLARLYLFRNDGASGLGTTPLPNGAVRVFQDDGMGGLRMLASGNITYVPIGDQRTLDLGVDPEVGFERRKVRVWRDEFWLRVKGGSLLRRLGSPKHRVDLKHTVAGWDRHEQFVRRIRNDSNRAIQVEIRRPTQGDVVFKSGLEAKKHDYRTVAFTAQVAAGEKRDLPYELITRMGRNAKRNAVTVEAIK